jgi:phosphohistidine swiveling domain-containing protein
LNVAKNDLIEISRRIRQNENITKKILSLKVNERDLPKNIRDKIRLHMDKYCWINTLSFAGARPYNFNHVVVHLKEIIENKERVQDLSINKRKRVETIKKYGFNKEIIALSDLIVLFTHWQDLRKESTMRTTFLATRYLNEFAKRLNVNPDDLAYVDFYEVDKLNKKEIKKRKDGVYFIYSKNCFEVYYPPQVKDIMDKILRKKYDVAVSELKGMCASKGKAIGKVKVILNVNEIGKVKKGDILVISMTRPEHLPAVYKSAAIITDDGGIISHAAIISRELNIPCIIGTKIATKVLKDGDLVEVNANKGIIKKIK